MFASHIYSMKLKTSRIGKLNIHLAYINSAFAYRSKKFLHFNDLASTIEQLSL